MNEMKQPLRFEPHGMFGQSIDGEAMPFGYISTATPMPVFELGVVLKWPVEQLRSLALQMAAAPDMAAALAALTSPNVVYDGNEIRIPCASHGDAIRIMREARAALSRATAS